MVKVFTLSIFFLILSSCITTILSNAIAEEPSPVVSTTREVQDDVPPPISRNPFVKAPHGRMEKTSRKEQDSNIIKKGDNSLRTNTAENITEGIKVKGVLLDGDYPIALLGHRIVKIGNRVGEFIVTDITRMGITLSMGEKVIQLPLE